MTSPVAAYEHNGRPVTREAFYAVACDPRRSVAVEACAGAGKTWMLVSRIVRALLAGALPGEILAITFTRKAAGEMRQRLDDWLGEWAHASPQRLVDELRQRGLAAGPAEAEALRTLQHRLLVSGETVQIRTFHGWFGALLGAAPLAVLERLGLPANYQLLLDDTEATDRLWRRFHRALAAEPQARADFEACVATHGRTLTRKALAAALERRVEFTLADQQGHVADAVETMAQRFPAWAGVGEPAGLLALPQVREPLLAAALALGRASQASFAAKGVELEQGVSAGDLAAVRSALFTDKGEPRRFSDRVAGLETVRAAQALAEQLAAAVQQHEGWLHQQRMTRLARLLLREYSALKRDHGWVDMNDLEHGALTLLGDPVVSGWVQERLDARVRHLLVDEFQDTNPLQWQALAQWLAAYAGAGAGAPAVFIVGDPKQSIYRFRRAEPRVFSQAQAFVREALGGDHLACDHTRRNAQAVLAAVNAVFGVAQGEGLFPGFRVHTTESDEAGEVLALSQVPRPEREAAADAAPVWRDSLSTPRETEEERLVTVEARQAAAWIAGEIAAGTRAGDILVLARRRDRLAEMEAELRALHIPAQQPDAALLREQPAVQDVVALLDVLVSPGHDLSLARALRSPLFGLDDAALARLAAAVRAQATPGRSWFEVLTDAREGPREFEAVAQRLLRWRAWLDELPPHDALAAIYRDGDVVARFAAAAPAALRPAVAAHVSAVPGAALEIRGGRQLTAYALVRALKTAPIEAPARRAADAVQLLTVHRAKGLEASVVLLLDTDAPPPATESMGVLCDWPVEAPAPRRFVFLASEQRPPACCAEALAAEREARGREELNALYVALTRARRRLVLSSLEPHRRATVTWWQRLQPHAAPTQPAAAPDRAPQSDAAWPMPDLPAWTPPPAPPPADAGETADAEAARFGSALHRLLEWADAPGVAQSPARLRQAQREFGLDAVAIRRAADMAGRILHGEAAWAWDPAVIDWHGNEVELHHAGTLLRLDRLVRRRDDGGWWVIDYKSALRPQDDVALVNQLRRYREAVGAALEGGVVRAAFINGQGRWLEIE